MNTENQQEKQPRKLPTNSFITPCCGYVFTNECPVRWNSGNHVIQCHNCGQTFSPCLTGSELSIFSRLKIEEPKECNPVLTPPPDLRELANRIEEMGRDMASLAREVGCLTREVRRK